MVSTRALMTALFAALLALPGLSAAGVPAHDQAVAHPDRSEADRQRDARSQPAEMMAFMGVEPGMTVLDVFSGGGYYSELLSYVVGDGGKVYAHTNAAYQGWVGDQYNTRFADNRLSNVVTHVAEVDDLALDDDSLDLALMVMSYHDVYYTTDGWPPIDSGDFIGQIYQALKPGGTLVVIDHVAEAGTGSTSVQDLHRIDPEYARKDFEIAGFVFVKSSDALQNPADVHSLSSFDPQVRGKTDKFAFRFVKPEA